MTHRFSRIARLLAIPALLAMTVLTTATASAGSPCFHGYEMPSKTTGAGTDVQLMPCAFDPTVAVIGVGESVTFINESQFTHLVTGAAHEWGSADVEILPNQTVTYAFDTAGVYPYACSLHPGMSGAIVVGDLADAVAADVSDSTAGGVTGTGSSASSTPTVLLGFGLAAGMLAGIAVAWMAFRRRSTSTGTFARAE